MSRRGIPAAAVCFLLILAAAAWAGSASAARFGAPRSLADRSLAWPGGDRWRRLLLLEDYNTRVVILGTALLGCAGGMVGSFALLRKRALMGDALSHATAPGIVLAFMLATWLGGDGKSLPVLLLGATASGLVGVGAILAIRNLTRLKEDTALCVVLSVFFGAGIALLGVSQQMPAGHAAGLEGFIYGKTASMGAADAGLIAAAALVCIAACLLLFKELKLICFDEGFAGARGYPIVGLDLLLMSLIVLVCIVGLQAVGLILIIALLVIPAAASRFWTEKMHRMALISSCLGAAGGMVGAAVSALFAKLPSGAMIVLVCTGLFLVSMLFGLRRGVVPRSIRRRRLNRTVDRQHLLRGVYEIAEDTACSPGEGPGQRRSVSLGDLLAHRSWSPRRLLRALRRARRSGLVDLAEDGVRLTARGMNEAARLTRQHRLWELYLITWADLAPALVDREADAIEHVLEPEVVAELEALLEKDERGVPASPHPLVPPRTAAAGPAAEEP